MISLKPVASVCILTLAIISTSVGSNDIKHIAVQSFDGFGVLKNQNIHLDFFPDKMQYISVYSIHLIQREQMVFFYPIRECLILFFCKNIKMGRFCMIKCLFLTCILPFFFYNYMYNQILSKCVNAYSNVYITYKYISHMTLFRKDKLIVVLHTNLSLYHHRNLSKN